MKGTKLQNLSVALFLILISLSCSETEVENFGENFDRVKMNQFFSTIDEKNLGMGSVSIFKDGKEDYQTAFGNIVVGNSTAATAVSKYRIGSISKTFTATLIMQLVDEDKLTLDASLATYFPEVPNAAVINIEQLLRHQSGLFNYTSGDFEPGRETQPGTRGELLDFFSNNGTIFQPGERTEYSNTNFVLLSFIIEEIDGKTYTEALYDRIIQPLGLQDTYNSGITDPDNNEAFSYNLENGTWVRALEVHYSLLQGAGSVLSTPTGINAFYQALFNGDLVSEDSLIKMKKTINGYGMGLYPIPFYSKSGFGHTGAIDGFQSTTVYFPSDDVSISYVSNGVSMLTNDIVIGALSIYSGLPYDLP